MKSDEVNITSYHEKCNAMEVQWGTVGTFKIAALKKIHREM